MREEPGKVRPIVISTPNNSSKNSIFGVFFNFDYHFFMLFKRTIDDCLDENGLLYKLRLCFLSRSLVYFIQITTS